MFNGEVDHIESPPRDDSQQGSEQTTPTKVVSSPELEDTKPSVDEPSDPQVGKLNWHTDLVT